MREDKGGSNVKLLGRGGGPGENFHRNGGERTFESGNTEDERKKLKNVEAGWCRVGRGIDGWGGRGCKKGRRP